MKAGQALLLAAFILAILLPLIPALLYLLGSEGGAVLHVPSDRDDDARHFSKKLKRMVDEEWMRPQLQAQALAIDASTRNTASGSQGRFLEVASAEPLRHTLPTAVARLPGLPGFRLPAEGRIAILSALQSVPGDTVWLGDAYSRNDIEVHKGATLRTLRSDGHCLLHPQAQLLRWVDARSLYVMGPATLPPRTTASHKISLSTGIGFERIAAPTIEILDLPDGEKTSPSPAMPAVPDIEVWRLQADDESVIGRKIFDDDVFIGDGSVLRFDLICHGDLHLGADSQITGNIKVHGQLYMHPNVRIQGHVFCENDAVLNQDCHVDGVLSCLGKLDVGPACTLGTPGHATSVLASELVLRPGVCIHGQVWARDTGVTHA
jgi:cytoskeletal protein CcmA (bactofilin family)